MSDLEIEKAAMGPRRWIELFGAFENRDFNEPSAILCPRSTTTIINDSFPTKVFYEDLDNLCFLVPGGRYLVNYSPGGISVLDLGYTSGADCKLIASIGLEDRYDVFSQLGVQASPDGDGLIIFIFSVR